MNMRLGFVHVNVSGNYIFTSVTVTEKIIGFTEEQIVLIRIKLTGSSNYPVAENINVLAVVYLDFGKAYMNEVVLRVRLILCGKIIVKMCA